MIYIIAGIRKFISKKDTENILSAKFNFEGEPIVLFLIKHIDIFFTVMIGSLVFSHMELQVDPRRPFVLLQNVFATNKSRTESHKVEISHSLSETCFNL